MDSSGCYCSIGLRTPRQRNPANNGKPDAFQALRQRAFAAFPEKDATDIFAEGEKTEDDILQMYYDISAIPLTERKASFRNASSNDKSNLWRTHLVLFLLKHPELNEWQKEIILAAMSLETPEYFEVGPKALYGKQKCASPCEPLRNKYSPRFL